MSELAREPVTFLFSDIQSSTTLIKGLGDRYPEVIRDFRRLVRASLQEAGGREVDAAGDTFLVAFARPDAAVLGAVHSQRLLLKHSWPEAAQVRIKMGMHTGEVSLADGQYFGMAVHRAARLCQASHGGQILVSHATHALVEDELERLPEIEFRDLGEHLLRDFDRAANLYQVVAPGLPDAFPPVAADQPEPTSTLPTGTVTCLFTDIVESTELTHRLGDRWRDAHSDHRRIVRTTATDVGGREVDTQGDSFFFAFASARAAVTAAAEAQRALAAHPWPDGGQVRVRMGIHTGEPMIGDEGYLGIDVVRGARLCAAAHGGQVVLSETTRALVAAEGIEGVGLLDLGEHRFKGLRHPERVYQLVIAGLQTAFRPLNAVEPPAQPSRGLEIHADELAEQAELAVRDLRTSIEESVVDSLQSVPGVGAPLQLDAASIPAKPPGSRSSPLVMVAIVALACATLVVVYLLAS